MLKLISCYVTGFGRLENFEYDFKEGLNSVLEENGWGKTTFCVFLKSMFYGLEYRRTKNLTERKHYQPWSGAPFGGSLTFSLNGKTYRVERTFGAKDAEDTFTLIDVLTGGSCEDYSANLGEEIFGVDRESFEKSIFAPQGEIKTSMTDSLNAKMGDLSAAKDDMNNFDSAIARIEEAKKEYSLNSKVNPGKLMLVQREISSCRELAELIPVKLDAYEKQGALLTERNARLLKLKEERGKIAEKIALQSKREQEIGALKEKREHLLSYKDELSDLDDYFSNGIPEAEEIAVIREKQGRLQVLNGQYEAVLSHMPSTADEGKLNELFHEKNVTEEVLSQWDASAERIKELRHQGEHNRMPQEEKEKLNELKFFFSKKVPTEEEIELASQKATELLKADTEIEVHRGHYRNLLAEKDVFEQTAAEEKGNGGSIILMALLGLVCLAGGFVFYNYIHEEISLLMTVVFLAVGGVLLLLSLVKLLHNRTRRLTKREGLGEQIEIAFQDLEEKETERENIAAYCKSFLTGYLVTPTESMQEMIGEIQKKALIYKQLLNEEEAYNEKNSAVMEELSALQIELYTALAHFASLYKMDLYQDGNETELLFKLHRDFRTYVEYKENKTVFTQLKQEKVVLEQEISAFLNRFSDIEDEEDKLTGLEHHLRTYQRLSEQVEVLEKELEEKKEILDLPEEEVSVEQLQAMQQEMEAESDILSEQLVRENEEYNRIADEIENCEDAKEQLEDLLEEEKEIQKKIDIYDATLKYLQAAKESFLGKYMGPLRKGLREYLSLIYDNDDSELIAKNFSLDMDLSVQFNYHGSTKEEGYLSAGYKDLVAFCSRLALIDALYQNEKPLLVLDDPFTDLDEDKIEEALKLLREIAGNRQVLYFTCHQSRLP